MAKKKHHEEADYKDLHKVVKKATGGGACLWGHKGGYSRNSCCYRWQAHEIAKHSRDMKGKLENYAHVTVNTATSAYLAKSGAMFPAHYTSEIDPPQPGDWDVEGPNRNITRAKFKNSTKVIIKKGKNFTKDTWPWWNNAHHLIPKGTLLSMIAESADPDPRIATLCKQSLLDAKYNVNEKDNMMFMPMDAEVGRILSLPRHLGLGSSGDKFDHKGYNATVKSKLQAIIDEYIQACKDADDGKPHPEIKADLNKKRLVNLSLKLFRKIRDFTAGEAIDQMPFPNQ